MSIGHQDPRLKTARDTWAEIAPSLGLAPDAFQLKVIWQKEEPDRSHMVLHLNGPRRFIMKMAFRHRPTDPPRPALDALRAAHARLKPFDKAHAPEVLYASDNGDVVVMTEAVGKTFEEHMSAGRNPAPLLRRAGAWLACFHQGGDIETRTYQPRFMLDHIRRMVNNVQSGALVVPQPDLFVEYGEFVPRLAVEEKTTISADRHGDFNLRNLMLGPEGETGLDFKPVSTAPVGFDIARFLTEFAELFQPVDSLSPGDILSDHTCRAFFSGYSMVSEDDPAVQFLPYIQLLNDWRLIPVGAAQRSWRQSARFDAIVALVRNAMR